MSPFEFEPFRHAISLIRQGCTQPAQRILYCVARIIDEHLKKGIGARSIDTPNERDHLRELSVRKIALDE